MPGPDYKKLAYALLGHADPEAISDAIEAAAETRRKARAAIINPEQDAKLSVRVQSVIMEVQTRPLPEGATRYHLSGRNTDYEGLMGLTMVLLEDYGLCEDDVMEGLKSLMEAKDHEALVVVDRNGRCSLSKVDKGLLVDEKGETIGETRRKLKKTIKKKAKKSKRSR